MECLIYEMLFIRDKTPKLNAQCDSIKAKLFTYSSVINTLYIPHCIFYNMQQDFNTHFIIY